MIGPVTSFRWQNGDFEERDEWHAVLATSAGRFPELEAHLISELPEPDPRISAVPLTGSAAYLDWIDAATR